MLGLYSCGVLTLIKKQLELLRISLNYFSVQVNITKMSSYAEAVYALNGLQSNYTTIEKSRKERDTNAHLNLINTEKYLNVLGIQVDDLNSLNIIHVAGTKGKGSTCAFTESILRHHGYKTGFYSSPHLISVNERIRINGKPINKEMFADYFWKVYRPIQLNLKDGETMPPYFQFLTIMAFYIFVKEKIQAAIIEVGIGGLYDCTNIIRKPIAVGITTLGMDHVNILGNSITKIAEQKAGILKTGVPAFTVSQTERAMAVLSKQAQIKNCILSICPPLEAYEPISCSSSFTLSVPGMVQNINASLALQLSKTWLDQIVENKKVDKNEVNLTAQLPLKVAKTFYVNSLFQNSLNSCAWPGRFQTFEKDKFTFYLDGAHTQDSMKYCAKWFEEATGKQRNKLKCTPLRLLIFNCTGERRAENLLNPLADMHFDAVVFCPNRLYITNDSASDQSNFMVDPQKEMNQCTTNKEIWCHLMRSLKENELCVASHTNSLYTLSNSNTKFSDPENSLLFPCLSSAINWILYSHKEPLCDSCTEYKNLKQMMVKSSCIQILVTGSLHLVGGVLALLQL